MSTIKPYNATAPTAEESYEMFCAGFAKQKTLHELNAYVKRYSDYITIMLDEVHKVRLRDKLQERRGELTR